MKKRPIVLKRRLEGMMNNHLMEQFRYRKAEIITYGDLFIKSEGGYNWENLWKGSDKSPIDPHWLHFYYDLNTNKFQELIKSLFSYPIGDYRQETLIQEIDERIQKIKEINPSIPETPNGRTQVNIESKVLEKNKEKIEFLFDRNVVYNYPWVEHERKDVIIFRPINEEFKDTLLDGYYSIINHYQNKDRQKIQKLENEIQDLNKTIQSQNNINQEKITNLHNKIATLDVSLTIVEQENQRLMRVGHKSDEKKKAEEKETPDSIAFILTFLYRIGILESHIWPEEKTDLQIAAVLTDLLTLRGRNEINIEAFSRDRKRIINQEERGQNILAKHDADAKQAITKRFPKFDFEQQEFLLKFKSKAK